MEICLLILVLRIGALNKLCIFFYINFSSCYFDALKFSNTKIYFDALKFTPEKKYVTWKVTVLRHLIIPVPFSPVIAPKEINKLASFDFLEELNFK